MEGSLCQNDIIRCIHIALLCVQEDPNDRPTMAKVVSFLNNPSVDLPLLTEQSFFMKRTMDDNMVRKGLDSMDNSNCELTASEIYPRWYYKVVYFSKHMLIDTLLPRSFKGNV
jgi:hypothetical protein